MAQIDAGDFGAEIDADAPHRDAGALRHHGLATLGLTRSFMGQSSEIFAHYRPTAGSGATASAHCRDSRLLAGLQPQNHAAGRIRP